MGAVVPSVSIHLLAVRSIAAQLLLCTATGALGFAGHLLGREDAKGRLLVATASCLRRL